MKRVCLIIGLLTAAAAPALAQSAPQPAALPQWSAEVVETFRNLPVQEAGRVKPLSTFARFELLQISGKTSFTPEGGERRDATTWLLDTLFFPEIASDYDIFLIESGDAMDALGLEHEKMRDRFSYNEIRPARSSLFNLARQYSEIEQPERTYVQTQIVNLAHNVHDFERLSAFMAFARHPFEVGGSQVLQEVFHGHSSVYFSDAVSHGPDVLNALMALRASGEADEATRTSELNAVSSFLQHIESAVGNATAFGVFPPPGSRDDATEWLAPADLMGMMLTLDSRFSDQATLLGELEALERAKHDPAAFKEKLDAFAADIIRLASARGEYETVPLEVTYYKANLFRWTLPLYILAFLLAALCWLRPPGSRSNTVLAWSAFALTALPLTLHTAAIVLRCIIRGRPPVSTLYETLIFITAVAVLTALVIEFMNRRRIAIAIGSFLGALGVFLSNKYEMKEGVDTMPSLIAVLDTNFWLSTHVTTITIGYAAGMLAGAIAHIYLLGKLFKVKSDDKTFYKSLSRMTYGVLCFGLLFSAVGTVLGGIWANDSWGRFWGWDPKENGALMIVLWQLIILHGRMSGLIRDFGVNMCAVFGAIIVAFSWFGVNLLGVGLHSYGFTSGIFKALVTFYAIESLVMVLGGFAWLRDNGYFRLRAPERAKAPSGAQPEPFVK